MTARGVNQNNDLTGVGLEFQCNELGSSSYFNTTFGNATDIFVTAGNPSSVNNGIAQHQGDIRPTATISSLPNNPLGNVPGQKALNNSTTTFTYVYSTTGSAPELLES